MDVSAAPAEEATSKPADAPKPAKRSTHELPWYASRLRSVFSDRILSVFFRTLRIEKYRPTKLKEVVGNEDTISRLEVSSLIIPCHKLSAHKIDARAHTHTHTHTHAYIQVFSREGNVPNLIIAVSFPPPYQKSVPYNRPVYISRDLQVLGRPAPS